MGAGPNESASRRSLCQPCEAASVYLGGHWLIYSESYGDFVSSQMLAPGLALESQAVRVELPVPSSAAACLLHAAGQWSCAASGGVVVLYLDPLSACGNALQHMVAAAGQSQTWKPDPELTWVTTAPDALCSGDVQPARVRDWVQGLSERLGADLPRPVPVAPQLRRAADLLAREPLGRLSVASLGTAVGWSAEHLRKEFRRVAGVTLSRYQLWRRMLRMVASACEQHARGERVDAATMILDAGFYDTPHGGRAIRRHFGITSSDAAAARVRFVDCR